MGQERGGVGMGEDGKADPSEGPRRRCGQQTTHVRERVMSQIELPSRERAWCWVWECVEEEAGPGPLWQVVRDFFSVHF